MAVFKLIGRSLGVALTLFALALGPASSGLRMQPSSASALVAIETGDNYYSPLEATVSVGETVMWTNLGGDSHTITAADGSWGTDDIEPGASFSYTFTSPGTYAYFCLLHVNHHRGTIIVR